MISYLFVRCFYYSDINRRICEQQYNSMSVSRETLKTLSQFRKFPQNFPSPFSCGTHSQNERLHHFWNNYRNLYDAYHQLQLNYSTLLNKYKRMQNNQSYLNDSNDGKIENSISFEGTMRRLRDRPVFSDKTNILNNNTSSMSHSIKNTSSGDVFWKLQQKQEKHHLQQMALLKSEIDALNEQINQQNQQIQQMKEFIHQLQNQHKLNSQLVQSSLNKLKQVKQQEDIWKSKVDYMQNDREKSKEDYHLCKNRNMMLQSQNRQLGLQMKQLRNQLNTMRSQKMKKEETMKQNLGCGHQRVDHHHACWHHHCHS